MLEELKFGDNSSIGNEMISSGCKVKGLVGRGVDFFFLGMAPVSLKGFVLLGTGCNLLLLDGSGWISEVLELNETSLDFFSALSRSFSEGWRIKTSLLLSAILVLVLTPTLQLK